MKRFSFIIVLAALAFMVTSCSKYKYETVKGDPLKTRIYTLDNGLKIYMSVNKETPRIQTFIAVNVGGKNDPAETTGLAHYFEHLMFKGTPNFGTSNFEVEKPLLDKIEQLFEVYRNTTDEAERKAIYAQIDSISYEASKYAIPNEYDKLMSAIGASGTNAFTSQDITAYMEDIPSNQIENWARIQADRFKNPVIRAFHTELETVYEEKNMSLTQDSRKVSETLDAALYPNHPYGTQTVLGTQEHLKNPSIINIRNYHKTYYVPNNMAVCVAGDFNPDQMIAIIDKYFGDMQPNENLPKLQFESEQPITTPIVKQVLGLEAENVAIAWRTDGATSDDALIGDLVGNILYNGKAGLIDLNLNQQQKVLNASGYFGAQPDYGALALYARPKSGQTLDQVRDLLLGEVAKLRNGDFDEELLEATINNYKVQMMQMIESNFGRAYLFIQAFNEGQDWKEVVDMIDKMGEITKDDVVAWAQKNLGAESYAIVYKHEGKDPNEQKISKPQITPILTNRDAVSDFVQEIQNSTVNPIEPVFIDFEKDMSRFDGPSGLEVLYKENQTNGLFSLTYLFDAGAAEFPTFGPAFTYLDYLGTPTRSAAERNAELYNLACDLSISASGNKTYITLSGLSENMDEAMEITEDLIANAQPDETILANMKGDLFKRRADRKLSQDGNYGALQNYVTYGPDFLRKFTLTNSQLQTLSSDQLLSDVRNLLSKKHRILYYGPMEKRELLDNLAEYHKVEATPEELKTEHIQRQLTPENKVYIANYDAKQVYYFQFSNRGEVFDVTADPQIALYNDYFGGGMNSIVFQEMREARGLAYTANAFILQPHYADTDYGFFAFIATQNDKLQQAIEAFDQIINDMPESEAAFSIAKESLLARLRTERVEKDGVLWSYVNIKDMGLDVDRSKQLFEKVQSMTLADVKAAQEKWVKGRTYSYGILGDIKDLNTNYLSTLGPVQVLSQEEIFGY